MDLPEIDRLVAINQKWSISTIMLPVYEVAEMSALIKKQEQALSDSNLALMEQQEIAQAANRQAEEARTELEEWRFTNKIDELQREVDRYRAAPQQHAQAAQPVKHNPHTGQVRDQRDVASDPQAILCVKPGEPLRAAPVNKADKPFYDFWYSHMFNEQMAGALADISHSTARYIWDAAIGSNAQAALSDELPPLPRAAMLIGPDMESLSLRYTKQQMLDYGRAILATRQPAPVASAPAVTVPVAYVPVHPRTGEVLWANTIPTLNLPHPSYEMRPLVFAPQTAAAPVAAAVQGDALIEAAAKAIYGYLPARQGSSPADYPWQDGGNSHMQTLARDMARSALAQRTTYPEAKPAGRVKHHPVPAGGWMALVQWSGVVPADGADVYTAPPAQDCERDAARYRFLRKGFGDFGPDVDLHNAFVDGDEKMDTAIDAAMAAQQGAKA